MRNRVFIFLVILLNSFNNNAQIANTFTAANAQITDTLISSGRLQANCIHATDTIVADLGVVSNDNMRVVGDINLSGSLVFDGVNSEGLKYIAPNTINNPFPILSLGKTIGQNTPWVQNCPTPGLNPWFATSGGFISTATNPNNQVNAGLKIYSAPWNGFGFIEVEGVNEVGMGNNALEINYFCGRNTHINKNSSLSNGGGWVRMGTQVSMDKHVEIGDPINGINDPNNTALQIHANDGKGLVFKTWNGSVKLISLDFAATPGLSPFTVYGDGKTIIGTEKVVGTHADAKLQVAGKAACKSFYVLKPTTWQDRVFTSSYKLMELKKVEQFIKTNKHLPGLPSEKEIIENGYDVNEMDAKLLEKIENLYLYIIKQQEEIDILKKALKNSK